jgi:hypothetical protein
VWQISGNPTSKPCAGLHHFTIWDCTQSHTPPGAYTYIFVGISSTRQCDLPSGNPTWHMANPLQMKFYILAVGKSSNYKIL